MKKDLTKEQKEKIREELVNTLNRLHDEVLTPDNKDTDGNLTYVVAFSMEDILKSLSASYGLWGCDEKSS